MRLSNSHLAAFYQHGHQGFSILMSKASKNGYLSSSVSVGTSDQLAASRFSGRDEEPEATRNGLKIAAAPISPTDIVKRSRRRFSLEDKRRILRLADACTSQDQIGALLRREGIYRQTLSRFIAQRDEATLASDVTKSHKHKSELEADELRRKVALLERQNNNLTNKLRKAEIVIDFQKKLSQLLALETDDSTLSGSERS